MKLKFTLFAAAALLSLSAVATEAQTVVLADGSTAIVLTQKGANTTYVKEAKAGTDGKVKLIQGQVFDGERLVKKADGKCLTIRDHLVRLEDVSVGGVKIQVPTMTSESKAANCNL